MSTTPSTAVVSLALFLAALLDIGCTSESSKGLEPLPPGAGLPEVRNASPVMALSDDRLEFTVSETGAISHDDEIIYSQMPKLVKMGHPVSKAEQIRRLNERIRSKGEVLQSPIAGIVHIIRDQIEAAAQKRDGLTCRKMINKGFRLPAGNSGRFTSIPLTIRAHRYAPFHAVYELVRLVGPGSDPDYFILKPAERFPPYPIDHIQLLVNHAGETHLASFEFPAFFSDA